MLVLDKWLGNADGRQAVFSKRRRQRRYSVTFIDQGYCFNAGEWNFNDLALRGVFYQNHVYAHVQGWEAFEPVLNKAETVDVLDLWRIAERIPPEWWLQHDDHELERLVDTIYQRRTMIRELIGAFRYSTRCPFPNWKDSMSISLPAAI